MDLPQCPWTRPSLRFPEDLIPSTYPPQCSQMYWHLTLLFIQKSPLIWVIFQPSNMDGKVVSLEILLIQTSPNHPGTPCPSEGTGNLQPGACWKISSPWGNCKMQSQFLVCKLSSNAPDFDSLDHSLSQFASLQTREKQAAMSKLSIIRVINSRV